MLLNVPLIGLTADKLDQSSEQDEAVVGIFHARSRLEAYRAIPEEFDVVGKTSRLQAMCSVFRSEDVTSTPGVAQELANGYTVGEVPVGIVVPVVADGCIER